MGFLKKMKSKFLDKAVDIGMSPHVPTSIFNYFLEKQMADKISSIDTKKNTQEFCNSRARNFAYVMALIASKIDNDIDEAETTIINNQAQYLTDDFKPTIDKLFNNKIDFNLLCSVYKANYKNYLSISADLSEPYVENSNKIITKFLQEIINADNFVTPEEDVLLIIWGLIKSNSDMLDFYIITENKVESKLNHTLFSYLIKNDIKTFFPNSVGNIPVGTIAIKHPFDDQALVSFKDIFSDNCENEFCDGILQILQILGAKRIHIKNVTEDETSKNLAVESECKAKLKADKININASNKFDYVSDKINKMEDSEEIIAEFSGINIIQKITNKLFLSYKLSKYKSNHHYSEIIKLASSVHNKIKKFEYIVNYSAYDKAINTLKIASEVGFIAKGINVDVASAHGFDYKRSNSKRTNKSFLVEF
jgi:hypothetical protein